MDLQQLLTKAESSSVYRWLLNRGLGVMIPFNRPHGFKVEELSRHKIKIKLPYRRSNLNHIRGIHACALATVSEFSTGLMLIKRLDPTKYRLIMQRLEMDYHYQGKVDSFAVFEIQDDWLDQNILQPLTMTDAVVVRCEVKIFDGAGHHLTTGNIFWQIKDWRKVRTKLS